MICVYGVCFNSFANQRAANHELMHEDFDQHNTGIVNQEDEIGADSKLGESADRKNVDYGTVKKIHKADKKHFLKRRLKVMKELDLTQKQMAILKTHYKECKKDHKKCENDSAKIAKQLELTEAQKDKIVENFF